MIRQKSLEIRLAADVLDDCPDGATPLPCPACRQGLEVHQPALGQPDRLLATCDGCGAWFCLDCRHDGGGSVLFRLPDPETVWKSVGS